MQHQPVLRDEVVSALAHSSGGDYIDATFGRGGHATALLAKLSDQARLLVIDRDPVAIRHARALAAGDARIRVAHGLFSRIDELIDDVGFAELDGVLYDSGVSSPQLDDSSRGFSFQKVGPLDMRMDPQSGTSAAEWLNGVALEDLEEVIRTLGEERRARRIAQAMIQARPFETTAELVSAIEGVVQHRNSRIHPATRIFQAIRIYINDELNELLVGLRKSFERLKDGGRIAVLTFHSLEHRIVRNTFRDWAQPNLPRGFPIKGEAQARGRVVVKGLEPTSAEVRANPRSRSAKLQVIERVR